MEMHLRPMAQQQLNLFLIALGFFTRIPVPDNLDFSQQKLNQASRYFTLVGWVIGLITAMSFYLASWVLPNPAAVIIALGIGFMVTGGFHEDGLADTADGLGGGWTPQKKLTIMKDSRIGSYGALALWWVLSYKAVALSSMDSTMIALLVAHPLSRTVSTALIFLLPYVTEHEQSKVKPLAESQAQQDLLINLFCDPLTTIQSIIYLFQ